MSKKPDWDELGQLFAESSTSKLVEWPEVLEDDLVTYLGEVMPFWLACDLAEEKAAILEFSAGLSREEAEAQIPCVYRHDRAIKLFS